MEDILNGEEVIVSFPKQSVRRALLSNGERPKFILVKFTQKGIKEIIADKGDKFFHWLSHEVYSSLNYADYTPIMPEKLWKEKRMRDLESAIQRRENFINVPNINVIEYIAFLLADKALMKLIEEYSKIKKECT